MGNKDNGDIAGNRDIGDIICERDNRVYILVGNGEKELKFTKIQFFQSKQSKKNIRLYDKCNFNK